MAEPLKSKSGAPFEFDDVLIETERLFLRPISHEDADDLHENFGKEIVEFMDVRPAEDQNSTQGFISESIARREAGEEIFLVARAKESGEFMGCASLRSFHDPMTPELSGWAKVSAQGMGFAKEAAVEFLDWVRATVDFTHLNWPVEKRNIPSCRLAEMLGGIPYRENEVQGKSGRLLELVVYKILPEAPSNDM